MFIIIFFHAVGCCTVSLFLSVGSFGGVSITRQNNTTLDSKRVSYLQRCRDVALSRKTRLRLEWLNVTF